MKLISRFFNWIRYGYESRLDKEIRFNLRSLDRLKESMAEMSWNDFEYYPYSVYENMEKTYLAVLRSVIGLIRKRYKINKDPRDKSKLVELKKEIFIYVDYKEYEEKYAKED